MDNLLKKEDNEENEKTENENNIQNNELKKVNYKNAPDFLKDNEYIKNGYLIKVI